jgi:hypothetical protein
MNATIQRNWILWLFDLLLSVYLASLFISAHESAYVSSWSIRMLNYYSPGSQHLADNHYRLGVTTFLLTWITAAVVLLAVRIARLFYAGRDLLRILTGALVVVGFPLAIFYSGGEHQLFLEVELGIATLCIVLASFRQWPLSSGLNALLLFLHFALWSFFGGGYRFVGGWYLFWPTWYWGTRVVWQYAWLFYPTAGFVLGVVWVVRPEIPNKSQKQLESH